MGCGRRAPGNAVSQEAIIKPLDTSDTPKHELTIELRDVVREYRVGGQSVRALDEISLRLTGGQFVSVVGPSGAGKSTLLHLLGALDSPDSGSISFDGDEIGRLSDEQQSSSATIASASSSSSSTCCPPCRRGRTSPSRSCSTVSGSAKSNPMLCDYSTVLASVIEPSIDPPNSPAAKCSGSR